MKYLYILNYGMFPGFYIYKIDEFEDVEKFIKEKTNFNFDEVNYMIHDQIVIESFL